MLHYEVMIYKLMSADYSEDGVMNVAIATVWYFGELKYMCIV